MAPPLPWILSTLAASLIFTQVAEIPFNGQTLPFPYDFGENPLKIGTDHHHLGQRHGGSVALVVYIAVSSLPLENLGRPHADGCFRGSDGCLGDRHLGQPRLPDRGRRCLP